MKKYERISRYNPSVPFDLYKVLLRRKQESKNGRVMYKDLVKEWGVGQPYMANAVFRGIKQYDYRIWKESQGENRNRTRPFRRGNNRGAEAGSFMFEGRLQRPQGRTTNIHIPHGQG